MIPRMTKHFRYGVVWKLITLGTVGALIGVIAEIFVVTKEYSNNVGVCTSTSVSYHSYYSYHSYHVTSTSVSNSVFYYC